MARRRPQPSPAPTPSDITGTAGNDSFSWSRVGSGSINGGAGIDTLTVMLGSLTTDIIMTGAIAPGATARLSTGLTFQNIEVIVIATGSGNDQLFGGAGNDLFSTSLGDDQVNAGAGNDWIGLAEGRNIATGGAGADTFFLLHNGQVTITDFAIAQGDKIFLDINGLDITTSFGLENGFLRFSDSAAGAVIEVDFDGSGSGFSWSEVAVLQGIPAALITPDYFVA